MKRQVNVIFIVVFMIMIVFVPVYMFFADDRDFSENENRYLSEKPRLTMDNILTGKYFRDFEGYVDDQFAFRESLYEFKTKIQKKVGNRDINGVYLADDSYLIEKTLDSDLDNNKLLDNIKRLNEFGEKNSDKKMQLMIVPTASLILQDKLPKYALNFNQDEIIDMIKDNVDGITFIDLRDNLLQHRNEYIYYKTDHHWTTLGSFYGYQEWGKYNDIVVGINDYTSEVVSSNFKGSLYSKTLDSDLESDEIRIFRNSKQDNYEVFYNFKRSKGYSVYDFKKLEEKDKYQFFLGGNYPELRIKTNNENGKNLLLMKDSYANSFVPFMLEHYENIYVIDMRYFKQNLDEYMALNDVSEILFLYNALNFVK